MLTAGEIAAIEQAQARLLATVEAAEQAAKDTVGWFHFTPIGYVFDAVAGRSATADMVQERAETTRGLWKAINQRRNELVELPDYDHEAAAELVAMANRHAGVNVAAEIRDLVKARDPVGIAAKSIEQTAEQAAGAAKTAAAWTVWGVLPLLGLALVAFLVWQLAPFFKGSR